MFGNGGYFTSVIWPSRTLSGPDPGYRRPRRGCTHFDMWESLCISTFVIFWFGNSFCVFIFCIGFSYPFIGFCLLIKFSAVAGIVWEHLLVVVVAGSNGNIKVGFFLVVLKNVGFNHLMSHQFHHPLRLHPRQFHPPLSLLMFHPRHHCRVYCPTYHLLHVRRERDGRIE